VRLRAHHCWGFPGVARAAACYGSGVRALGAYLGVWQHVPVERATGLLDDGVGADVSVGWLGGLVAEAAEGLGGFVDRVREQLAGAEVAHFDETGARVAGRLHWVHSASTPLLSLFTVHAKRGVVAMDAAGVLPGFDGVAVHDGWSPYRRYPTARHALCAAHLLRELEGSLSLRGRAGPPSWPSGSPSPAPRPPVPATPAPTGLRPPSWRA
jgi:transposase